MAELATMTAYDDASVNYTFEPDSDSTWVETSSSKQPLAKLRQQISKMLMKNKLTRRMYKTDVPVMEVLGTVGTQEGYVAAPRVAHNISVSTAVFCDESRATAVDVANALKLHINSLLGDTTAGTAGSYVNASPMPRKFLIHGIGGD